MPLLKVGSSLPYKLEGTDGCTVFMEPTRGDEGIESMFAVSLPQISRREFDALTSEPIRFGILPYAPLVFILLEAPGVTVLDSPFGIGLYPPETVAALLSSARCAHDWPPNVRRSTILAVIDPITQVVQGLRKTTLTRNWWIALCRALERCPTVLSRSEYNDTIQRAYSRWRTPVEMLQDCRTLEEGGK
jgi:hypothetical protein